MAQRVPKDFKEITDDKTCLEGILAELIDASDFSRWKVYIQAPEGTPFSGGIFLTHLTFPPEYPMQPPELVFISEMFHPNVYPDGKVCISILHPPGKDIYSDERPEERWMPSHTPVSIFNCFLTLLSEPNIFSPANIDASVMWRDNKTKFGQKAKDLVSLSKKNVPEGVLERIPHPDTDPRHRARRIADKIASLDTHDDSYGKTKIQLQKVIQDTLAKLSDKALAASLYNELCPSEIEFDQGGDDELVQAWDDDDDVCEGFADDDDTVPEVQLRQSNKRATKPEEKKEEVKKEEPKKEEKKPTETAKPSEEKKEKASSDSNKTKKSSSSSHKSSSGTDKHKHSSSSSKHSDGHKDGKEKEKHHHHSSSDKTKHSHKDKKEEKK